MRNKAIDLLLRKLSGVYQDYIAGIGRNDEDSELERIVRRWFRFEGEEPAPADRQFLEETESLSERLVEAIRRLEPGERAEGAEAAAEAVRIMLLTERETLPKDRALFLTAAETLCRPLLPFVEAKDLESIRTEKYSSIPSWKLLPKQAELLREIDRLLEKGPADKS